MSNLFMPTRMDTIDIIGYNGDQFRISGPGEGAEGVWLAPHSTGLFDMPFKTNWGTGIFGQRFQSWKPERRDIVWTLYIANPDNDLWGLERDPDTWHWIYSRVKAAFPPGKQYTIVYTSVDGERRLYPYMLETPKSCNSVSFEGKDPHLWSFGSIMMTSACEIPYYDGGTESFSHEFDGTGSHWFTLPYFNPTDVDCWPEWELTAQAQWNLPDFSWGNEEWGRGQTDLDKTVALPLLLLGESISVNTRPDLPQIISATDTPVMNRMAGRALEYPILAGAGDPSDDGGCTVWANQITAGAACVLKLPRWWGEPFGTPAIVRTRQDPIQMMAS